MPKVCQRRADTSLPGRCRTPNLDRWPHRACTPKNRAPAPAWGPLSFPSAQDVVLQETTKCLPSQPRPTPTGNPTTTKTHRDFHWAEAASRRQARFAVSARAGTDPGARAGGDRTQACAYRHGRCGRVAENNTGESLAPFPRRDITRVLSRDIGSCPSRPPLLIRRSAHMRACNEVSSPSSSRVSVSAEPDPY